MTSPNARKSYIEWLRLGTRAFKVIATSTSASMAHTSLRHMIMGPKSRSQIRASIESEAFFTIPSVISILHVIGCASPAYLNLAVPIYHFK